MCRITYAITSVVLISLSYCTSSVQEPWISIFDGTNTNGWEIRDGFADLIVEDGQLVTKQVDSINFAYLIYKEELSDFILECKVKLTGPLNSGILIKSLSLDI